MASVVAPTAMNETSTSAAIDALLTSLPSAPAHVPGAATATTTATCTAATTVCTTIVETKDMSPTATNEVSSTPPPTIIRNGNELCVVFDLNGTLVVYSRHDNSVHIPEAEKKADKAAGRQRRWGQFYLRFRPHLDQLLELLFEKLNARVGVWTFSGRGPVAAELMTATFGKYASRVEFCYCASKCPPQHHKLKDLKVVWTANPSWIPHRTLLIDDDTYKAGLQPHNAIIVPSFSGVPKEDKDFLLTLISGLKKAHESADVRVKDKACLLM